MRPRKTQHKVVNHPPPLLFEKSWLRSVNRPCAHGVRITVAALLEGGHPSAEPAGHCAAVFSVRTGPTAPYHRNSP